MSGCWPTPPKSIGPVGPLTSGPVVGPPSVAGPPAPPVPAVLASASALPPLPPVTADPPEPPGAFPPLPPLAGAPPVPPAPPVSGSDIEPPEPALPAISCEQPTRRPSAVIRRAVAGRPSAAMHHLQRLNRENTPIGPAPGKPLRRLLVELARPLTIGAHQAVPQRQPLILQPPGADDQDTHLPP